MPIKRYKIIQTGPKIQFGGLKDGLFKEAYHVAIEGVVNIEPIAPARRQTTIEMINFIAFFITYQGYLGLLAQVVVCCIFSSVSFFYHF